MFLAWSYSAGDQPQSLASFSKSVICAKMLTVVRNTDSVGSGQEQKWTDPWLQGISRSSRSTLTHTCHNTHTHTLSYTPVFAETPLVKPATRMCELHGMNSTKPLFQIKLLATHWKYIFQIILRNRVFVRLFSSILCSLLNIRKSDSQAVL